jgi:hypothetical protein
MERLVFIGQIVPSFIKKETRFRADLSSTEMTTLKEMLIEQYQDPELFNKVELKAEVTVSLIEKNAS